MPTGRLCAPTVTSTSAAYRSPAGSAARFPVAPLLQRTSCQSSDNSSIILSSRIERWRWRLGGPTEDIWTGVADGAHHCHGGQPNVHVWQCCSTGRSYPHVHGPITVSVDTGSLQHGRHSITASVDDADSIASSASRSFRSRQADANTGTICDTDSSANANGWSQQSGHADRHPAQTLQQRPLLPPVTRQQAPVAVGMALCLA